MSPVLCELRWPLAPLYDAAGRRVGTTLPDPDGSGAAVGRTRRLRCHQRGLVNWGQPHCAQSRPAR